MDWKLLIFLVLLYGGIGMLQARWVARTGAKTCLQDRCLIPVILALLVLALTVIGWRQAAGWDTLGWYILVHYGSLPLAGAVILGALAGLLLHRKKSKAEKRK